MKILKLIVRDYSGIDTTIVAETSSLTSEVYTKNKDYLLSIAKFLNTTLKENFIALVLDENYQEINSDPPTN